MKTLSRLLFVGLVLASASFARAQEVLPAGIVDADSVGSAPFLTQINTAFPGHVWGGFTTADNLLGRGTGGYFTLGGKMRIGEDIFGARYLVESQGHLGYEDGNIFFNVGLERVYTIKSANSDISLGIWYDGDKAPEQNFGHTFKQIGVSGGIRNNNFAINANGYFPVEDTGFVLGNPLAHNCFYNNFILSQPGIDTALTGFDVELRLRPVTWAMFQGTVDLGGYYYTDRDEQITGMESFGGARVRVGVETLGGVRMEGELNQDERFNTTAFFRMVIDSVSLGQYDPRGTDLNRTSRRDNVVVYHQDPQFVINPLTGAPYRVVHVDSANTSASGGSGTAEDPYTQLSLADGTVNPGNSLINDLIFVQEGVGPYAESIRLLNGQQLLGDGIAHNLQTPTGTFLLCNQIDGQIPTIQGITLANNNLIRGFNIIPTTGTAIAGTGLGGNILTTIDQVQIMGGIDGINLTNVSGTYNFLDSDLSNAIGMSINNVAGTSFQVNGDGGGAALVVNYAGDIISTVASGQAIVVDNTIAGSMVNFAGGNQINDMLGAGIFLNDVNGSVMITTPQTLASSTGPGITIQNAGFSNGVPGAPSTGLITIANTNITDSTLAGVFLNNNNFAVPTAAAPTGIVFNGLVINETDTVNAQAAIGFQAIDTNFLTITGNSSISSIGTGQNTGNAALVLNGTNRAINLNATLQSIASTFSASQGINLTGVGGLANAATGFGQLNVGTVTIDDSNLDSILIQNDAAGGLVSNWNLVNITDAGIAGTSFGSGVRINTTALSTYNFNTLNIETDNGHGLFATDAGVLNVLGGTIDANGGAAIIINPTEVHATFNSVMSTNSVSDGINIGGIASITGAASTLSILNTTVTGAAGTGIIVSDIRELGLATEFTADFGTTTINAANGISADDTVGGGVAGQYELRFANLNATATNGDGLTVNDVGSDNVTLDFNSNAATVAATNGRVLNITGGIGQNNNINGWVFNALTSTNSTSEGMRLSNIGQSMTFNGLIDINNSTGDGIVLQNTAMQTIDMGNIDIDGTGGDGVQVSGFTGTFNLTGGGIDAAGANSVNIANGATGAAGNLANFNVSNLVIQFAPAVNGLTGINVSSGDGTVTIANNGVNMSNTTGATGIFVQGNNTANGLNLGATTSVSNTTSNLGAGSVNFNFNNGGNISGDIEVDNVTFNP